MEKNEVAGVTFGNHIKLKVPVKKAHFWSPEFDINVSKNGKGSRITGVIGPNPRVWVGFVFLYSLTIILFFLGALMGIYRWVFDMDSPLFWSIPISISLAILIIVLARIGQYKGKSQMKQLWLFFNQSITERETKLKDLLDELSIDEDLIT